MNGIASVNYVALSIQRGKKKDFTDAYRIFMHNKYLYLQ